MTCVNTIDRLYVIMADFGNWDCMVIFSKQITSSQNGEEDYATIILTLSINFSGPGKALVGCMCVWMTTFE